MLNILIIFLTTFIIQYFSFVCTFKYINKYDNLNYKHNILIFLSTLSSTFIVCLFLKFKLIISINFIGYSILIMFLFIFGYIDYISEYVYKFLLIMLLIFSILFMLRNNIPLHEVVLSFIFTVFICMVVKIMNGFNWGDIFIFMILSLTLGYKNLLNIFLSFFLGGLISIPLLILKRIHLKDEKPLCPYILLSTFLIIMFFI